MARKRKVSEPAASREDAQNFELVRSALGCLLPPEQADRTLARLRQHLGSFSTLVRTPEAGLAALPEVDPDTARFLHLTLELAKAALRAEPSYRQDALLYSDLTGLLRSELFGRKTEAVAVVLLDGSGRRLYSGVVISGEISAVRINIRNLVERCVNHNATYAVLGHNHPTGVAVPSVEDIVVTAQIAMGLINVDVTLRDHIILTDDSEFSFANSGLLAEIDRLAVRGREEGLRRARDLALHFSRGEPTAWDAPPDKSPDHESYFDPQEEDEYGF